MRKEANRAHIAEQSELRPVTERAPRSLDTEQRLWLFTALRGDSGGAGVRLQLACATAQEPAQFCEQLAAVMKKAGWTVTRAKLAAADAGAVRAQRIEVATDADEGTQAAADALADALERDGIIAKGPADAAPDGQLPSLRVTVQ
jgi:hypothetical protein